MNTLDETANFFRRLGSKQALIILYLVDEFQGIFVNDLATLLGVAPQRVIYICRELEESGIIKKHYITRKRGRLAKITADPDALKTISRFLKSIGEDQEVIEYRNKYQNMKDEKLTLSDKYQI
jgi:DNA-binding Lrp family transcriptional regulator